MKKKFLACILTSCMVAGLLVGCNNGGGTTGGGDSTSGGADTTGGETTITPAGDVKGSIRLLTFTEEVKNMCLKYVEEHPDFGYSIDFSVVSDNGDEHPYQVLLNNTLNNGDPCDIYTAEAAYVLKYTQGAMSQYAVAYEELIPDVNQKIKDAEIAQYTVDIGTRDGKVVGLGYQATGGAMIYRRSIAKDVWGNDDPAFVAEKVGSNTGSWETFWKAADDLKAKGYVAVSGSGDIWNVVEKSTGKWLTDDEKTLVIDKGREDFLDISKKLKEGGYSNDTTSWTDAWYADMKGVGDKGVFAFFGPGWLLNYTLVQHCGGEEGTFGDWAICDSPVGFFWGGTWVLAGKSALSDPDKAAAVAAIIEWITLDTSETGLQYRWANGTDNWKDDPNEAVAKDVVASSVVMEKSKNNGNLDFLAGQNMFDYFIPANENAARALESMTQYDSDITGAFTEQAGLYAQGEVDRDGAIAAFKQAVKDKLDIAVD